MPRRTIAIGDIHGCAKALAALIEVIKPTEDDVIVPLGDYVDRGPESREVVDLLIDLVDRCQLVPLLGNHESMMLDSIELPEYRGHWCRVGGRETLESYGCSLEELPFDHLVFLRGLKRYYETDSHLFVHANYDASLPLEQQSDRHLLWEHVIYTLPGRHCSGKTAIVGHTPQGSGEILDMGYLVCIDTYCFGGGWLTALDVESGKVWQANRDGELRR
ncbi:MAG: metallophosphoesterase family protein [Planctomycetota bacterium]|nr:metallophosphoesterase family protein [Planctomycetota bacterium]